MSHFAKIIPATGEVTEVIVAEQDFINSGAVGDSFLWVQTSYHGNFRKRFAGAGGRYLKEDDVFIEAQSYKNWKLDENFNWQPFNKAGVSKPDPSTDDAVYMWDESTDDWKDVTDELDL